LRILIIIFLLLCQTSYAAFYEEAPTADGTVQWGTTEADNHSAIDEFPHDSDTTYTVTNTVNNRDIFTFDNMNIPSGETITNVTLECVIRRDSTICVIGGCEMTLKVTHDATYTRANVTANLAWGTVTHNVSGSEAWIPADFDGQVTTFGYQYMTTGSRLRVTKCDMQVTTADAGDPGDTRTPDGTTVIRNSTVYKATIR